ncbi:hypothetical protein D3C80_1870070 [compost metagenome]
MVLHGECREFRMFKTFDSLIVIVNVCYFQRGSSNGGFRYRVTMVLGSNVAATGLKFLNRVVPSAVTKLQALRIGSAG